MAAVTEAASALPELAQSTVTLTKGGTGQGGDTLVLMHLAEPQSAGFSTGKKQCDLWEFVWGTSLLLASVLRAVPLEGADVLEIGGGGGMCSLAASKSGAARVTMTDLVADALEVCKLSARANGIAEGAIAFRTLDWNKQETVPEAAFDLVIGSDVLFYRGTVGPVAQTFARALRPGGVGVLADPFRLNTDDFEAKLSELGIYAATFLFTPETLQHAQQLAQRAFVDVKKVKVLVFCKPSPGAPRPPLLDLLLEALKQFATADPDGLPQSLLWPASPQPPSPQPQPQPE